MFKFRILLMLAGGLLTELGLVMTLAAATNTIGVMPQPTVSALDQTDDIIAPEQGFAPLLLPTSLPPTAIIPTPTARSWPLSGQDLAASMLSPAGTSLPSPATIRIPDRIVIPAIQLDAPVVSATLKTIAYEGKLYPQWKVPKFFAAGWAPTSASLGKADNTVLFGHHNADGEVFGHLVDLQAGDLIELYSGEKKFSYVVALKMILQERNQPVEVRLQNASWILPSTDERLTLLTCWPYISNTHRLVIVAIPISADRLKNYSVIPRLTPQAP